MGLPPPKEIEGLDALQDLDLGAMLVKHLRELLAGPDPEVINPKLTIHGGKPALYSYLSFPAGTIEVTLWKGKG